VTAVVGLVVGGAVVRTLLSKTAGVAILTRSYSTAEVGAALMRRRARERRSARVAGPATGVDGEIRRQRR
jgi:hypothetical protein